MNDNLEKLVEKCIEIASEEAYKGSYAAPREAFRAVLSQAYKSGEASGLRWAKRRYSEDPDYFETMVKDRLKALKHG
jgi:hypothetical protein